jgi:hypothetical protein
LIFLEHSDASCLAAATFDLPDEGIDTCDSPDDCAYYPASTCLSYDPHRRRGTLRS